MKMLVGLGNPGKKYAMTRHNIGFITLDDIAARLNESDSWKTKAQALFLKTSIGEHNCLLVKPQTFMNLSGQSVLGLMTFFKVKKEDLLVIQDDLSLAFGAIRYQADRSPGGHNGIKDIHAKIGSNYSRLKVGISSPATDGIVQYVLDSFTQAEQEVLPEILHQLTKSIEHWIDSNTKLTANLFNTKKGHPWDSK